MESILLTLAIVCPLVFLASFVDAVAGGGGLISLPAYLLAGLPAHMALGTNKVVSSTGTLIATIEYLRKGKIFVKIAVASAIGAAFGGMAGSNTALLISDRVIQIILLIILPITAIFLASRKKFGEDDSVPKEFSLMRQTIYALLIGVAIGFYDGMVGPGTGTFMILAFTKVFNLDLVKSSGCAKMSNLASNVASAVVFSFAGKVMWAIVVPAAVCCMIGGKMGAHYAIKGGSQNVRKMIFVVIGLLFVKFIYEMIK